jgi:hypothetical protein
MNTEKERQLAEGRGGMGRAWSLISILPEQSLGLYNHSILSGVSSTVLNIQKYSTHVLHIVQLYLSMQYTGINGAYYKNTKLFAVILNSNILAFQ